MREMYDMYFGGRLLSHFPEEEFYKIYTEVQHVFTCGHWEEVFNAPVSQEFILVDNEDGSVIFTLIKD